MKIRFCPPKTPQRIYFQWTLKLVATSALQRWGCEALGETEMARKNAENAKQPENVDNSSEMTKIDHNWHGGPFSVSNQIAYRFQNMNPHAKSEI